MIFGWLVANLFASTLLLGKVLALDLSAPHFSLGGVNYPELALLEPEERNEVIKKLVNYNATVIRLFITGNEFYPDIEPNLGVYDDRAMRRYDDTLWAIYKISGGRTKVILAPHNVDNLRGTNDYPCDAYCKHVGQAWLDFYVTQELRARYKQRLSYIFNHYVSKNFKGATLNQLSDVILGVDVQNSPFEGVHPIPAGEPWICDIAEHLKEKLGLGKNNIAVISGGVSGGLSEKGDENMPESVWSCDAIDVIGLTGYYPATEKRSSGAVWAERFRPGSKLIARALKAKKLLLVEETSFVEWMHSIKAADVWDQLAALNLRGIPWLYANVRDGSLKSSSEIRFRGTRRSAIWALHLAMKKANLSPSVFDWSSYMKRPTIPTPNTAVCPNQWKPYQDTCLFGCEGWLCDSMDGCRSDLICKNNLCQPCTIGCPGMACDGVKSFCQEQYQCVGGTCQACVSRDDLLESDNSCEEELPKTTECARDLELFSSRPPVCQYCDKRTRACRGAPCQRAADCDSDEFCDWGLCKPCKEGCMGMKCTNSKGCKSGFCNEFGACDYPPPPPKKSKNAGKNDFPVGRKGPCGPGQDCGKRKAGGLSPQPVLQGNAHSRGAGEMAAKAASTAKPTAT